MLVNEKNCMVTAVLTPSHVKAVTFTETAHAGETLSTAQVIRSGGLPLE